MVAYEIAVLLKAEGIYSLETTCLILANNPSFLGGVPVPEVLWATFSENKTNEPFALVCDCHEVLTYHQSVVDQANFVHRWWCCQARYDHLEHHQCAEHHRQQLQVRACHQRQFRQLRLPFLQTGKAPAEYHLQKSRDHVGKEKRRSNRIM